MQAKAFLHFAAGLILASAAASSAQAQVSLAIGSPGFYGAIDIGGGVAAPAVVYQQPMMIAPVAVAPEPLYLYVPPEQYGNWGQYCGYYDACGRAVFFVQPTWYQRTYVPYYRSHRSFYDGRRAQFDRHHYRPGGPGAHRGGPAPRGGGPAHFDNHRGGPSGYKGSGPSHPGSGSGYKPGGGKPSGMGGGMGGGGSSYKPGGTGVSPSSPTPISSKSKAAPSMGGNSGGGGGGNQHHRH